MLKLYDRTTPPNEIEKEQIASFLFKHLDEFGDPQQDIEKAMAYATDAPNTPGGLLIAQWDKDALLGAVVINKTGMKGYIPENILVYIATHEAHRGKGIGKKLMKAAITHTDGDIALHVEADNPAKQLYENLGFTNKYLEMRLKKES